MSQDQTDLRSMVVEVLADRADSAAVRAAAGSDRGYDEKLWSLLSVDLGLVGLAVPEELGGVGASFVEVAVVLEQLGARLVPSPYASTVAAIEVLRRNASATTVASLLPALADGSMTAALAVPEPGDRSWPPRVECHAVGDGGTWRLTGTKSTVVDAVGAGLLLVAARIGDAVGLFAVAGDATGLIRTPVVLMDQTRRAADVTLDGTPAMQVGGAEAVTDALRLAAVVRSVEAVGSARRCLELTVDYLKTRVQFGRPLGSFQALRHRAADLFTTVEAATSTAWWAALQVAEGGDLSTVGPLAQAVCAPALMEVAAESVQLHGGIAITWEHDAQLYLKRAAALQLTGGTPRQLRRLLASAAGVA